MDRSSWVGVALVAGAVALGAAVPAHAQIGRIEGIAEILSEGRPQWIRQQTDKVQIQTEGSAAWVGTAPGATLSGNERIQVQPYVDARLVVATRARPEMTFLTSLLRGYVGRVFVAAGAAPQTAVYRVSTETDGSGDLRVDIERGALVVWWKKPGRLRVVFADKTVVVQGTELAVEVDADGDAGHIFVTSGVVSLLEHPDFVVPRREVVRLRRGLAPEVVATTPAEVKLARQVVSYHGTAVWGNQPPGVGVLVAVAAAAAVAAVVVASRGSENETAMREGTVQVELTAPWGRVYYPSGTRDGTPVRVETYRLVLTVTPSSGDPQVVDQAIDPASLPARFTFRLPEGATRFRAELRDGEGRVIQSGERTEGVQQDRFEVKVPLQRTPPLVR